MKNMLCLAGVVLTLMAAAVQGKIVTGTIDYKEGSTTLEGYLAYEDTITTPKPAIIVIHEWTGLNDYTKMRCEMLAKLGYVAFAADIYGKGIRAANTDEAGQLSRKHKNDRALTRARVTAALDWIKQHKLVDSTKIAAIGYCFGGMVALELARSGADVRGVVTFHGSLDTPTPGDANNIKAKVLVLHGAIDPYVSADVVKNFEKEMNDAHVNYELVKFGGAVHGFSNPNAGDDVAGGYAYNAQADKRSWQIMLNFFDEIFQ